MSFSECIAKELEKAKELEEKNNERQRLMLNPLQFSEISDWYLYHLKNIKKKEYPFHKLTLGIEDCTIKKALIARCSCGKKHEIAEWYKC